ncbi:acyl-CoA synthetase [Methylobacterium gnaphalii]|uniref:Acetyl-CoA synthetase n=1 Tax=Methylobacterium gnaphalii TaxID=1010610 RepID=A0A512JEA2_9HYPH|nr:AMP-binding protein [Methylobacterium gnaphalii]GEP08249.1 acetyl-CoA synthetase [Methylobacterium gnaphalii]GJD67975.1 Acetyl-coenzyme A synthetase [Methylobacterium gnaphalii]GLS51120.1 acetyl-CoA synthetase [Methylobacterium gnaphalii]
MLTPATDYAALVTGFSWDIPDRYNIAADVCDRWAVPEPDRPAIMEVSAEGTITPVSYGRLRDESNRLANALAARGIGPGDRIAVLLPQSSAVVVAHLAAYRLGAIALPLAGLFGAEALRYRLTDSGARAIVTNAAGLAKLEPIRGSLPDLTVFLSVDGPSGSAEDLSEAVTGASAEFATRDTGPDDPALMIYTSGTTGLAKGALHGHRVLLGHLPGWSMMHDFPEEGGGLMWTPSDWAWAGGLLNVLMPSLRRGMPVVARPLGRFEPEAAFQLIASLRVTNAFLPPTALRMLRGVERPRERFDLSALRNIASAGEALGPETFAWARDALGLTIGEAYGQTECNLVLASCARAGVARPGSTGRPVPGHRVAILREDGNEAEAGETGEIAVKAPDPVMFLGYWQQPEATAKKFRDGWWMTGDTARRDADGYIHFVGRDDDLITSAAYRIGPTEIEDCLLRHPAVALAAAVGKPDPLRTEIVKAFVVLREGFTPSEALAAEILAFGRKNLSAHEYPRELSFLDALPMTTTGKIIRRQLRDGTA